MVIGSGAFLPGGLQKARQISLIFKVIRVKFMANAILKDNLSTIKHQLQINVDFTFFKNVGLVKVNKRMNKIRKIKCIGINL